MNYQEAKDTIKNRESKKLGNNTYLHRIEGGFAIKLHDTDVIELYPSYVKLFTGGWYSLTTKERLNKYAPVRLGQEKSIWYLYGENWEKQTLFYEGIKISYTGKVLSKLKDPKTLEQKTKEAKLKIKEFVNYSIEKIQEGIELPSGGDCWYCVMQSQEGAPLGDTIKDHSHIEEHIKEKYVVPALIWNAVKEAGYRFPEIIIGYQENGKTGGEVNWNLANVLRKYLQKRLLPRA